MKAYNKRKRPKHVTKGKFTKLWFIQYRTKGKIKVPHFKWINECDDWGEFYSRMLRTYKFINAIM